MNKGITLFLTPVILVILSTTLSFSQSTRLDSLRNKVQKMVLDSTESATNRQTIIVAYLHEARSAKSQEDIIYAYQQLAAISYNSGDINEALKYYKLYVVELEALSEFEEFRDHQFEVNLYENEIRALKEQIVELENQIAVLEEEKQENYAQNHIIFVGLRIALGLGILLLFGWLYQLYQKSKTKNQPLPEPVSNNQELTELLQKTRADLVNAETELALADILVQQSIFDPEEYFKVNKSLRRKFLISLPKDLASGTGLYLHSAQNNTLMVMFDSASSGAPGGLLAAQIYRQLDEIVKNLGINSPALLLERLESSIVNLFPAGVPFTHGVSCSVCLYDHSARTLTFSNAKLDLYEVKNGELHIYPGLDEAILFKDTAGQYQNQIIEVSRGSNYYLCTPAYWQQRGGHEYKPLDKESFEKTITSIERQGADEQQRVLSKVYEEWRGSNEQDGDVLVFGFML